MIPFIQVPEVVKFTETDSRMGVARGWGRGMETELRKVQTLWRWVPNNVEVLSPTEL